MQDGSVEDDACISEAIQKDFVDSNLMVTEENQKFYLDYLSAKKEKDGFNPTSLTLMVSQECNLRCIYCYGNGGEYNKRGLMNFEVAKQAVDFLVKNSKSNDLSVVFFGGEPLLNFTLMKQVVEYCNTISSKAFKYSITTNGLLINPEVENFLLENKFTIQISMDGVEGRIIQYASQQGWLPINESIYSPQDRFTSFSCYLLDHEPERYHEIFEAVNEIGLEEDEAWAVIEKSYPEIYQDFNLWSGKGE